ncbi:hypothetical protein N0V86_006654 [Didymella sp. IMI 355093]|nr:hypothetical protein N0V86_006654 [Didymella sp. IMI 355093]
MPDPPEPSNARDFASPSSDQASSFPPQDPRFGPLNARFAQDAPEGNAYSQGGYAIPNWAFPQGSPLIYPNQSPQQQHQEALGHFPSYHSFDPYAQAAWDWTQSADPPQLPTPYEPQGELIQELRDRRTSAAEFSNPLLVDPLAPPPRPLPQRPAEPPQMKRKSDAQRELEIVQNATDPGNPSKRRALSRASSTTSQSPAPTVLADAQASPIANVAQIAAQANQPSIHNSGGGRRSAGKGTGPQGREIDVSEPRRVVESSGSADMLPAGRVFPIQIGSALFRLSGASLCSDDLANTSRAPSYFSHFFSEQIHSAAGRATDIRTLYIDRDPDTFRDIALHLQGYHIVPRDGEHFVKLFADAQFYSLPRLTKQLFKSDIFIDIGDTPFRIPRDSFSAPGNSPNYFSLGFAQWFSTPSEVFPGLDRSALLRPPSISPPSVPNKSGEVFAELMKMLQGYEVEIRSETHRANLLRDARYFHLKGLEQKLINCSTSYNLERAHNEILIRLDDIRQSGVGFLPDAPEAPDKPAPQAGTVTYARPYTDDATANFHLVLETSMSESATIHLLSSTPTTTTAQATFQGDDLRRLTALLNIVASKMGADAPHSLAPSNGAVAVRLSADTALALDGSDVDVNSGAVQKQSRDVRWVVRRAHWRVRVEPELGTSGEVI